MGICKTKGLDEMSNMNLNICYVDHKGIGGKGFLHLLVKNGIDFMPIVLIGIRSLLLLRRRCKIFSWFKKIFTYYTSCNLFLFG